MSVAVLLLTSHAHDIGSVEPYIAEQASDLPLAQIGQRAAGGGT